MGLGVYVSVFVGVNVYVGVTLGVYVAVLVTVNVSVDVALGIWVESLCRRCRWRNSLTYGRSDGWERNRRNRSGE